MVRNKATRMMVLLMLIWASILSAEAKPELWFYNQTNLAVRANVDAAKALMDRAAAPGVGYQYMMLADTKLAYDGDKTINDIWDPEWSYYKHIREVIAYGTGKGIRIVPLIFEVGRADWLANRVDENLLEGQQVKGANFTVAPDGKSLIFKPQNPALTNTSFADGSAGWELDEGRASIDTSTGRTDSASLKISAGDRRGFGIQTLNILPHRQYHVCYWVREQNFSGDLLVKIYDVSVGRHREFHEGNPALAYDSKEGGWQQKEYVFNSAGSTQVQLRLGSWGPTTGELWFDDICVEEIALHNVIRNSGSSVKVYNGTTTYTEGKDFNPIREPYTKQTGKTYRIYRIPLTVSLPAGSRLKPGQAVQIDYDAVQPVYDEQYGTSLTEPAVLEYYRRTMMELRKFFPDGTPYMLGGFDELRQGGSSCGAKAAGLTGGQLLANHFQACYQIVRQQDPIASLYTWSDMFDPHHNAVDKYYLWESTLAESWKGVSADVTIVNWNLGNLRQSLGFFAERGNPQIIAGYYDSGDGRSAAAAEVQAAIGVPGVRGLMYTTWQGNYAELENYAAGAIAAWSELSPHQP